MVKNQQGFATEALKIGSGERQAVLNSTQSREKLKSGNFSRSARLAICQRQIRRRLRRRGRASPAAKRAFCHGMVKNQQRSAAEVLQISSSENLAVLNFVQSREKSSKCGIFSSEFHTLP
jgi:hypothetical protein